MNWTELRSGARATATMPAGPVQFWWRDDDAWRGAAGPEAAPRSLKEERHALLPSPSSRKPPSRSSSGCCMTASRCCSTAPIIAIAPRRARRKPNIPRPSRPRPRWRESPTGSARLRTLASKRFFPVLAPPWNRIRQDLLTKLPAIGIRGVSGYGARAEPRAGAGPAPGQHACRYRGVAAATSALSAKPKLLAPLALTRAFPMKNPSAG